MGGAWRKGDKNGLFIGNITKWGSNEVNVGRKKLIFHLIGYKRTRLRSEQNDLSFYFSWRIQTESPEFLFFLSKIAKMEKVKKNTKKNINENKKERKIYANWYIYIRFVCFIGSSTIYYLPFYDSTLVDLNFFSLFLNFSSSCEFFLIIICFYIILSPLYLIINF